MHSIEIYLSSRIADDSFKAIEIKNLLSRIRIYVPSTDYERDFKVRGNWTEEHFQLQVPNKFLESRFPLRFQAQFPGGSKLSVEAKVFEPTRVDLALMERNFIEGRVQHAEFAAKSLSAGAVGCELACPGSKKKVTGSDICIECSNTGGARFKLCC